MMALMTGPNSTQSTQGHRRAQVAAVVLQGGHLEEIVIGGGGDGGGKGAQRQHRHQDDHQPQRNPDGHALLIEAPHEGKADGHQEKRHEIGAGAEQHTQRVAGKVAHQPLSGHDGGDEKNDPQRDQHHAADVGAGFLIEEGALIAGRRRRARLLGRLARSRLLGI